MANVFIYSRHEESYIFESCLQIKLSTVYFPYKVFFGKGHNSSILILIVGGETEKNMVEIEERQRDSERCWGKARDKRQKNYKARNQCFRGKEFSCFLPALPSFSEAASQKGLGK